MGQYGRPSQQQLGFLLLNWSIYRELLHFTLVPKSKLWRIIVAVLITGLDAFFHLTNSVKALNDDMIN